MPRGNFQLDGDAVRAARSVLRLSQARAAAQCGIAKRTLENAESGRPVTRRVATQIAAALNVSLEALVAGSEDHSRHSYYQFQRQSHLELKLEVARIVASLVPPEAVLACASGTTVAFSLGALARAGKFCQVVTNNIGAVEEAGRGDTKIVVAGGTYVYRIHACVGPAALRAFEDVPFQIGVLGVSGIDETGGCYVRHDEDIDVYKAVIRIARTIIIAVDVAKLGQSQVWPCPRIDWLNNKRDRRRLIVATNSPERLAADPGRQKEAATVIDRLRRLARVDVIEKTSD